MQGKPCQVLSYSVRHGYDVKDLLSSYAGLLQRAIDIIWDNIKWVERRQKNFYMVEDSGRRVFKPYYTKRQIPVIPKSSAFKKNLRDTLIRDWASTGYAAHYVDTAIAIAYSIIKSWRKNYMKGLRRRKKPVIKRRFVRIDKMTYRFRDWRIRVTVKPYKQYLEFDLSKAWFRKKMERYDLGELILRENDLIVTIRKPIDDRKPQIRIGWDLNKYSIDGFSPKLGWIKIDLNRLYHIHRVHEIKRQRAQSAASKKPSIRGIVSRHGERERNRAKDLVHKITSTIAKMFPNALHGFENLNKHNMYSESRKHNRDISKQNWKQITGYMTYKARVRLVDPRKTSSTCPMCGGEVKLRKGRGEVRCTACGLTLDRQLCGSINIYLKMCGLPQRPSTFYRAVIRKMIPRLKMHMRSLGRVTAKGAESNDMPSMNPREGPSPMKLKPTLSTTVLLSISYIYNMACTTM